MTLYTPGGTWAVHFHHDRKAIGKTLYGKEFNTVTYCTIHLGPCAKSARPCNTPGEITGHAYKVVEDNFDRYPGRKVAFGRAVSGLPRKTRTALWRGFLMKEGVIGSLVNSRKSA